MLTTPKSIEEMLTSPIDRSAPVELHWRDGVYFMGRKTGRRLEAREIFGRYLGAQ